jgi:DNA-binding transcriptional ArsR family regulator
MSENSSNGDPPTTREAFELVGNETRAEILRVLSETRDGELPPALSFSELREHIGTAPRSSQFNYHLQKLTGSFIERREEGSAQLVEQFVTDEEGYALRPRGTFLSRVVAGMSTDDLEVTSVGPFETGVDCHYCGTAVTARYRNSTFHVQCPQCDHLYVYTLTPPGLLSEAPDKTELLDRADTYVRQKYASFATGSCPVCASAVEPEAIDPGEINLPTNHLKTVIRRSCTHCGNLNYALLGTELLVDTGVIAFCHEHEVDVREPLLWELPFAVTDEYTEIMSEDPWEAELTVPTGEAELTVRVDEDLRVLERSEE